MRKMRQSDIRALVLVVLVVGVGAWALFSNKSGSSTVSGASQAAVAVPFETIAHGTQSTVTKRVNYLITTSDQLQTLWKMISTSGTPPMVDFTRQAVIAVFAGKGASEDIAVQGIEDSTARMVMVSVAIVDQACLDTMKNGGDSPYELVIVPATTLSLTHTDTVTTASCPNQSPQGTGQ